MARLMWTEQGLGDLKAVHDFIGRDAEAYAELLTESLLEQAIRVGEDPDLGRPVPQRKEGDVRVHTHAAYRILYHVANDTVYILAVCVGGEKTD